MKRLISMTLVAMMVVLTMTGCKKSYTITVESNNDSWGSVTGTGIYHDGETVTISAIPASGYYFNGWNDGNAENPRKIVVSGDATYIATFSDTPGGGGAEGALEVYGSISANTTWPDRGLAVDYVINGRFYVEGNALLTIEPGVTIMFTGVDGAIHVEENAGLRMVGTPDKHIVFTGPANNPNKGAWNTVYVTSNRDDNQFEYVDFVNGGSNETPVVEVTGKISMKHCTVNGALGNGVSVSGALSAFENNTVKNVDKYPLLLGNYQTLKGLGNDNTYTNNQRNMIYLDAYYYDNEGIYESIKFYNQGIPYYAPQGMNLQSTQDVMRVYEGVEIVFGHNTEIYVGESGLIEVQGTESAPVIFRGELNEPGYWDGINYASQRTASSKLVNVTINNAGKYDAAALRLYEESKFNLNNVSISGSNGYGMVVSIPLNWETEQYDFSNYHVTASGLTFANCTQGNIYETNKDLVYSAWPGSKKR